MIVCEELPELRTYVSIDWIIEQCDLGKTTHIKVEREILKK